MFFSLDTFRKCTPYNQKVYTTQECTVYKVKTCICVITNTTLAAACFLLICWLPLMRWSLMLQLQWLRYSSFQYILPFVSFKHVSHEFMTRICIPF